jgi:hypothetical protein
VKTRQIRFNPNCVCHLSSMTRMKTAPGLGGAMKVPMVLLKEFNVHISRSRNYCSPTGKRFRVDESTAHVRRPGCQWESSRLRSTLWSASERHCGRPPRASLRRRGTAFHSLGSPPAPLSDSS